MYTIDSNIPVPADAKGQRHKYPLEQLKPGESFYVKLEKPNQGKNLRSSMGVRAKKLNITIVTHADETGVRVWRTA
jgi:hypothetical protein